MSTLPPFPVDDATLDLLWAAMYPRENGDPDAKSSGVWPLLTFMSQMGGSDTDAVEDESDDGSMRTMRDPHYHDHDVISSLITEVRRLRTAGERAAGWREAIEALRTDEAWKAAQQELADEWHDDACHCDAWPASCVSYPQSFAPSSWHPETVAPHFAAFLESLAPKETP